MLTDPALRAQVDALWDKLWSGGLPNPTDAIEQLSFLLFLKRLDEGKRTTSDGPNGWARSTVPFSARNCAGHTGPTFPPRPR
jgi:hypothetical protein